MAGLVPAIHDLLQGIVPNPFATPSAKEFQRFGISTFVFTEIAR